MEKTIILGLGNLLYGDEGFGVRLAQHLRSPTGISRRASVWWTRRHAGQTLLTFVEEADSLLVLDAVDFGLEPGELTLREELPLFMSRRRKSARIRTAFPKCWVWPPCAAPSRVAAPCWACSRRP